MTKALKRRTVAAAFRRMANGVEAKAAFANTLGFWPRKRGQTPFSRSEAKLDEKGV